MDRDLWLVGEYELGGMRRLIALSLLTTCVSAPLMLIAPPALGEVAGTSAFRVHDEFVRLVADREYLEAVSLALAIPKDAPEAHRSRVKSDRVHYASIVDAVIRDLGPIREYNRLQDQPEDVFYLAWRFIEDPNTPLEETCYRVEYAHYGPGYAFVLSLKGELVGFAFGISMEGEGARRRWADLRVTVAEIEGDRE